MKKNKNNLLAVVIIVLLIGVVFVAIVSKGFTNMDASTWFNKGTTDEPDSKEEVLAVDGKGNKLTASGNYSLPERMTFLSTRASTAADGILITAKFTPENATLIDLKWSVDYKMQGVSEEQWMWAGDCEIPLNQIIELTTTPKTCRVKCLQPFGCPIILKCESVSNPAAYATCQLDYAKRVTNFTPKFVNVDDQLISYTNDTLNWSFNKNAYLGFYNDYHDDTEKAADRDTWFTYDVGTVKDTYSFEYTVTLDHAVYVEGLCVDYNQNGTGVESKNYKGEVSLDIGSNFISSFGFASDGYDNDELMMEFGKCIYSCQTDHVFDLTIKLKGAYTTFEKTFKVNRTSWDYGTLIESIELTKPNLTF